MFHLLCCENDYSICDDAKNVTPVTAGCLIVWKQENKNNHKRH